MARFVHHERYQVFFHDVEASLTKKVLNYAPKNTPYSTKLPDSASDVPSPQELLTGR